MSRTLPEWIGKTDDASIPPRVRLRVLDRDGGKCHLCKLVIKTGETWDADHVTALINGGENRETNLAPAHKHCHVIKTAADAAEKSRVSKQRKAHVGIRPVATMRSKPFSISTRTAKNQAKERQAPLPPKRLFWPAGNSQGD